MARKTLLTESEIRQFMKLANIKPIQEMGGSYGMPPGMRDDEDENPPGMRDMREEEEADMEMDMEPADDMEMDPEPADMEMDMEPADDMDMDPEPAGDMGGGEDIEALVAQAVEIIAKIAGEKVDVDVQVGGEEDMGDEAMDDEGGDLEGAMDAPEEDEGFGVEVVDEVMGEEEIVAEVARRVAARLLREKKQDAMANKLAERIFKRLASK